MASQDERKDDTLRARVEELRIELHDEIAGIKQRLAVLVERPRVAKVIFDHWGRPTEIGGG
jgi:hypothetical protein